MKFIRIDLSISTFVLSLKRIRIARGWMDTKKPIYSCSYCFFFWQWLSGTLPTPISMESCFPKDHVQYYWRKNFFDFSQWTSEIRSQAACIDFIKIYIYIYMLKYLLLLRIYFNAENWCLSSSLTFNFLFTNSQKVSKNWKIIFVKIITHINFFQLNIIINFIKCR